MARNTIKQIQKADFRRTYLSEMKPNDVIIISHDTYMSMISTMTICQREKKAYPREDVKRYRCRQMDDNFTLMVTAEPSGIH